MIITVTQEDIEKGVMTDCQLCPVARAVARVVGVTEDMVSAGHGAVFVSDLMNGGSFYRAAKTPAEVSTFMGRFDHGISVEPFSFELPELDAVNK